MTSDTQTQLRLPTESWKRRIFLPMYSITDSARYTKVHATTIAYWHYGDADDEHVVLPGKERGKALNYLQLVEVAFVARFRRWGVKLQRLRRAHAFLQQRFTQEYPFAHYRFKTEGHHVLMEVREVYPEIDLGVAFVADENGQLGWEDVIGEQFMEFDYESEEDEALAVRWHVAGREAPILIDPRIAFGAPMIHGIPTWALRGRAVAGEPIDEISDDFELSKEDVIAALEFEGIEIPA